MLKRSKEKYRCRCQQQTAHRLQHQCACRNAPQAQHHDEGKHQHGLHEKAPEGDLERAMRDPQKLGEDVKEGDDQHAGAQLQRAKGMIRLPCFCDFHRGILHGNAKQGQ